MSYRESDHVFETYDDAQRAWETAPKIKIKEATRSFKHSVSASDLLKQLLILSVATNDKRFDDAMEALFQNGYISRGKWIKPPVPQKTLDVEENYLAWSAELVEHFVSMGTSVRMATATVAAQSGHPAHSFAAAVKAMERLWRERKHGAALDKSDFEKSNDNDL